MRVNELIQTLQKAQAQSGDVPVIIEIEDEYGNAERRCLQDVMTCERIVTGSDGNANAEKIGWQPEAVILK